MQSRQGGRRRPDKRLDASGNSAIYSIIQKSHEGTDFCATAYASVAIAAESSHPPCHRKRDLAGEHSIRINDQWRVVFRWSDGDIVLPAPRDATMSSAGELIPGRIWTLRDVMKAFNAGLLAHGLKQLKTYEQQAMLPINF